MDDYNLTNKQIWDNFKRLNLVQFAKDLFGYNIDTKGSHSKNEGNLELVYKNYTNLKMYQLAWVGAEEKQSNIILVRKNSGGEYFYTNATAPGDQGTIIDFIANRRHLDPKNKEDLGKIARVIFEYEGSSVMPTDLPAYVPVQQELKDRNAIVARHFKLLSEFQHPEYLLARGIDRKSLEAEELKGRIFNSIFKDTKGNQYINIVFPFVDQEDNLCGIEYKNVSFGGLQADSDRLIWRSNLVNPDRPVDAFIIGEAAIDVISYAQLKSLIGKNVLLITHAGNLHKPQIEAIQHLIDLHSPAKLILTEDRDTAGYRYDITLMGALNAPNKGAILSENDFKAEINIIDNVKAKLVLNVSFSDLKARQETVNKIISDFAKQNDDPEQPVFSVSLDTVTYGNHSAIMRIEYHVSEMNMKKALEIVTSHRGMSEFIQIDKPQGVNLDGNKITDWNELLMTEKKIHKNDIPGLMYDFKNSASNEGDSLKSNSFKPNELLQLFIKNWDQGIGQVQENAVDAGVSIDVISYLIAKNQQVAFNNFTDAVQRVYDLDFGSVKEFDNFKSFITANEEKFKEVLVNKKANLSSLENELAIVKAQLKMEGDDLKIEDYEELMRKKESLEEFVKLGKKSLGTYNEYLDAKFYNELAEIVLAKSKKVWDKTVKETMDNNKVVT